MPNGKKDKKKEEENKIQNLLQTGTATGALAGITNPLQTNIPEGTFASKGTSSSAAPPAPTPEAPKVIRNAETGEITGVILQDGRTLLKGGGLTSDDINFLAKRFALEPTPEGAEELTSSRQQELGAVLAQNVGNIGGLVGDVEGSVLNEEQAKASAFRQAFANAAAGAGVGLVAGGVGTPAVPFTVAAGTVIGLKRGLVVGYQNSLKAQASDNARALGLVPQKAQEDLRKIVGATWAGGDKQLLAEQFNGRLASVDRGFQQLQIDTRSDINKYLDEDGRIQLQRYYEFYEVGGQREFLINEMKLALQSPPDPQRAASLLTGTTFPNE